MLSAMTTSPTKWPELHHHQKPMHHFQKNHRKFNSCSETPPPRPWVPLPRPRSISAKEERAHSFSHATFTVPQPRLFMEDWWSRERGCSMLQTKERWKEFYQKKELTTHERRERGYGVWKNTSQVVNVSFDGEINTGFTLKLGWIFNAQSLVFWPC